MGEGGCARPDETSSLTADPTVTCVPATGFWLMTLPEATVLLEAEVTVPKTRPTPASGVAAAACVCPTTLGTATVPAWPAIAPVPLKVMVCAASGALFSALSMRIADPEKKVAVGGAKLKLSLQVALGTNGNAVEQSETAFCVKPAPRLRVSDPVSGWFPTF